MVSVEVLIAAIPRKDSSEKRREEGDCAKLSGSLIILHVGSDAYETFIAKLMTMIRSPMTSLDVYSLRDLEHRT